jgi:hypothetical protein
MPYPKCSTCHGTGHADGTPERPLCKDCRCNGCTVSTGRKLVKCATGGEFICEACMNAETSDGCPVFRGEETNGRFA